MKIVFFVIITFSILYYSIVSIGKSTYVAFFGNFVFIFCCILFVIYYSMNKRFYKVIF